MNIQEVYILKSAELNDSRMIETLDRITKTYKEGLGDVSQSEFHTFYKCISNVNRQIQIQISYRTIH